jgi:hypothetical protein
MSNHFWYRKYKFSVYFGIKIGVAVSTNTDLQSIGIKLKTLVSPITTDMQEHTELQNQTLPLTLSQTILVFSVTILELFWSSVLHNYIN